MAWYAKTDDLHLMRAAQVAAPPMLPALVKTPCCNRSKAFSFLLPYLDAELANKAA